MAQHIMSWQQLQLTYSFRSEESPTGAWSHDGGSCVQGANLWRPTEAPHLAVKAQKHGHITAH